MEKGKYKPFGYTPFGQVIRAERLPTSNVDAVSPSLEGGTTQKEINEANVVSIKHLNDAKLNINDRNGSYDIDINRPTGSGMIQEMRTYRADNDVRKVVTDSAKVQLVANYGTAHSITLQDNGTCTIDATNITLGGSNARYKNAEIVNADMLTDIANTIDVDITDIRNQIIQEVADREVADNNLQSEIDREIVKSVLGNPIGYNSTDDVYQYIFSTHDGTSKSIRYKKLDGTTASISNYIVLAGQYYTTTIANGPDYFTLINTGTGSTTSTILFEIKFN